MKTVFRFIILLSVCFGTYSCSDSDNADHYLDEDYKAKYTAKQIHDKLKLCADLGQIVQMEAFFKDWNSAVAPNSAKYVKLNDTIKQIHSLYKAIYDPLNLKKLGDIEWGNNLYKGSKYFVVQNSIYYNVVFSSTPIEPNEGERFVKGWLKNFRPELTLDPKTVLYLTTEYNEGIRSLIDPELPWPIDSQSPKPQEQQDYKYSKAVGNYLPLIMGHWGNYWYLETHPYIERVIFNQSMTKALVNFRIVYEGGEAIFDKSGENWVLKESHLTWVE